VQQRFQNEVCCYYVSVQHGYRWGHGGRTEGAVAAGLTDWLHKQGHAVAGPFHVQLTSDEEAAYGAWNQIGLAKPKRRPETMRHGP
jgi:hypothetical protein